MAELIRQVTLIGATHQSVGRDASGGTIADVMIDGGRIAAITPQIPDFPTDAQIIDGSGQFLGPGLIDLYSQSGEPGHESRETRASLRQAATAGGFTRVGLLPTTKPAVDNVSAIAAILSDSPHLPNPEAGKTTSAAKATLLPWSTVTIGAQGKQLVEFAELSRAGAIGFTDAWPLTNPVLVRRLLEYMQPLNKPIALWPCDLQLAGKGVARQGLDNLRLGLAGVSASAETSALAALIEYVAEMPTPIHVMRVSTARSVELIQQAKQRGLPITASVAWHHLCFDTSDLQDYSPSLRHNPPLGTPTDRLALVEAVKAGVLDAIAVDHAPYTYEEKTVAFSTAPPGAIGLELALPILWQTFVSSGRWSAELLWHRLSHGPARCLGLDIEEVKAGGIAELTLFNPEEKWTVNAKNLRSLSPFNTPWASQTIKGKATRIWNS
ncbi:MAG: dihydroorotase [Cyanobacteria bacterium P01_D01_bin.1]